jgi:hypothetical protein
MKGKRMKKILICLAASAAVLSASAGAFASTPRDQADNASVHNSTAIKVAQAGGGAGGTPGSGGKPDEITKKLIDSKSTIEMAAPAPKPDATGTPTTMAPDDPNAKDPDTKDPNAKQGANTGQHSGGQAK